MDLFQVASKYRWFAEARALTDARRLKDEKDAHDWETTANEALRALRKLRKQPPSSQTWSSGEDSGDSRPSSPSWSSPHSRVAESQMQTQTQSTTLTTCDTLLGSPPPSPSSSSPGRVLVEDSQTWEDDLRDIVHLHTGRVVEESQTSSGGPHWSDGDRDDGWPPSSSFLDGRVFLEVDGHAPLTSTPIRHPYWDDDDTATSSISPYSRETVSYIFDHSSFEEAQDTGTDTSSTPSFCYREAQPLMWDADFL
jgi:hypothetical protein